MPFKDVFDIFPNSSSELIGLIETLKVKHLQDLFLTQLLCWYSNNLIIKSINVTHFNFSKISYLGDESDEQLLIHNPLLVVLGLCGVFVSLFHLANDYGT